MNMIKIMILKRVNLYFCEDQDKIHINTIIKMNKFFYKIYNKITLIITMILNNILQVKNLLEKIYKMQIITVRVTNYRKILFQ